MQPNRVIANNVDNLKDGMESVEAPTHDINVGIDGSCKEGDNNFHTAR
jgi:hypothetical protein